MPRRYDCVGTPLRPLSFFLDHPLQVYPTRPPLWLRDTLRLLIFSSHSRCLHGALKGNIGVVKCALAELTDETNMARGFSFLLLTWALGYVIGWSTLPFGALSQLMFHVAY